MYEKLKEKYDSGYITKTTLKGYVAIELRVPGRGITAVQYKEITGDSHEV